MTKINLTTAAVSLAVIFAATGTVSAQQTRTQTIKPVQTAATILNIAPSRGGSSNVPDNTAHEWTAGCYAEFGPNAKYPDAALLEKCLNM